MSESEKTLRTIQTRANRKIWITAVLTLLFPFAGYIYTIRYKAAIIAFFAMFFLMSAEEAMDMEEDTASSLYGFFIIALTAENSLSVRKARELAQQKGLQLGSNHYAPLPDAKVQILKFGKQQGEVTLADLVIETGLPPEKIRDMVMELERQDLVRSYNREHDGAIVYRVI
jgi:uncharacterized membrane protein